MTLTCQLQKVSANRGQLLLEQTVPIKYLISFFPGLTMAHDGNLLEVKMIDEIIDEYSA